jgi:hypothetical protein
VVPGATARTSSVARVLKRGMVDRLYYLQGLLSEFCVGLPSGVVFVRVDDVARYNG